MKNKTIKTVLEGIGFSLMMCQFILILVIYGGAAR
jgi:hypothetical protein